MPTKEVYARDRDYYLAAAKAYHQEHRTPRPTLEDRLWAKVDQTETCWLWTGSLGLGGRYGSIRVGGRAGRMVAVHRLTYEWAKGPIPDGLELDHLCREPRCVRPEHLEAVTHAENIRRGAQAQAVRDRGGRCARHDELMSRASGSWVCRSCRRQANREYRARKKAAA